MQVIPYILIFPILLAGCQSQPTTQWMSDDRLAMQSSAMEGNIVMIQSCLVQDSAFTRLARESGARNRDEIRELARIVAEKLDHEGVITKTIVTYNDYRPTRTLLEDDDLDRAFKIAQEQGHVTITTNPRGAAVSIDGRDAGQTEMMLWMPEGRHTLSFSSVGFETIELPIEVVGGQTNEIHFSLRPQ